MLQAFKELIQRIVNLLGYEIVSLTPFHDPVPVEFSTRERDIMRHILDNQLTMVPAVRLYATMLACKQVIENGIEGDFVESGVWRGGNSLAAKLIFEAHGADRRVVLFDTFAGMTAPSAADTSCRMKMPASELFARNRADGHNEWCYASLEEVRNHFREAGADLSGVRFIQGDVGQTLARPENLPGRIAVLRLDTDWYESTRAELHALYPRLVPGGVLLIDDYGHWDGCRRAVDEYFAELNRPRPCFHYVDYACRVAVKPTS